MRALDGFLQADGCLISSAARVRAAEEAADGCADLLQPWAALLSQLNAAGNTNGYAGMALTVDVQQAAAERLSRHERGKTRRELVTMQALWAEFHSWIDDQHDEPSAAEWLELAHRRAQSAGNPELSSYLLMRRSQQSVDRGDGTNGVALAAQALHEAMLPARTRALGLIRQAQAHALLGDGRACAASLQVARRLAGRPDQETDLPVQVTAHCDSLYVAAHEAQCRLLLGEPRQAIELYQSVLSVWPGRWLVDEGMWRAGLAAAYLEAGQPGNAAVMAQHALRIATSTASARARKALARTAQGLGHHTDLPQALAFTRLYGATACP